MKIILISLTFFLLSGCIRANDKITIITPKEEINFQESDLTIILENQSSGLPFDNIIFFGNISSLVNPIVKTLKLINSTSNIKMISINSISDPYQILENSCSPQISPSQECIIKIQASNIPNSLIDQTLSISHGLNVYKIKLDPTSIACLPTFINQNGICTQDPESIECPIGYNNQNGICIQNPIIVNCPQGFINQNDICIQDLNEIICPNDFTLVDGVCLQNDSLLSISYGIQDNELVVGVPFSAPVGRIGGTPPFAYAVSPSLPSGLNINSSSGLISGTASSVSSSTIYTVTVQDSSASPQQAESTFSLSTVINLPLSLSYVSPQPLIRNSFYSFSPTVSGGLVFAYQLQSNSCLSTGLIFNSISGLISGTPTALGSFNCIINIQDVFGRIASHSFSYSVIDVPISLSYNSPINSVVGQSLSAPPTVSGFSMSDNLTYSISPALPLNRGLTFNTQTGIISGTASGFGSSNTNHTVQVSNGIRNTNVAINLIITYNNEVTENTVLVEKISPENVKIVNDLNESPNSTIYLTDRSVYNIIPFASIEDQNERFLPIIDAPNALSLIGTTTYSNLNLSAAQANANVANNIPIQPVNSSLFGKPSTIQITNLGQESINAIDCNVLRPDNQFPAQGCGVNIGALETKTFSMNWTSSNYSPNFDYFDLRIRKQFGSLFDFRISDLLSPIITQKQISNSDFWGELTKSKNDNFIPVGQNVPFQSFIDSFNYNNKLYFRLSTSISGPSTKYEALATWDGNQIEEIIRLPNGLMFSPTLKNFTLRGSKLYFTAEEGTSNTQPKLFELDLDSRELNAISGFMPNNGYFALKGGILFIDDGSRVSYYDFSDQQKYVILSNGSWPANRRVLDIAEDEFAFTITTSQGLRSGVYYVNDNRIQKISNINEGNSNADDDCSLISKNGNLFHMYCVVQISPSISKFVNYNTIDNSLNQTANLRGSTRSDSDRGSTENFFGITESGAFYFISGGVDPSVSKLFKIDGQQATQASHFSGSDNLPDLFDFNANLNRIFVNNNKLYLGYLALPGYTYGGIIEINTLDDSVSRYIPYSADFQSFTSGSSHPIYDSLGNMFYKSILFKTNGDLVRFDLRDANIHYFEDGKIIFYNPMEFNGKYFLYDGSKMFQVSNTTKSERLKDSTNNFPFANFFNDKVIINGTNSEGDARLFEVQIPNL